MESRLSEGRLLKQMMIRWQNLKYKVKAVEDWRIFLFPHFPYLFVLRLKVTSNWSRGVCGAGAGGVSGGRGRSGGGSGWVVILRINLLMTNKCKRIKKNTKHFFVMGGREDLYFREEVAASFKPYNRTKARTRTSITPTFNNDRKHYTYSFLIPSAPQENQQQLETDHRKRVIESLIEIEDILMPKPRSKHKYCGVCRGHYEDYKQHTEGVEHTSFLKRSTYQALIVDLCRHVQATLDRRDQKQSKQSEESKTIDLTCEENPLRVALESELSPRKSLSVREE